MSGIDIAKKLIGLHEVRNNCEIKNFLKKYGKDLAINPANTPWCAAFVNACERAYGNKGTGLLNARSFLKYGTTVKTSEAKRGDIVIFARGGSTWQGHVAYFDGFEKNGSIIRTVGGNQSDSVSVGWYGTDRLIGVRRPI